MVWRLVSLFLFLILNQMIARTVKSIKLQVLSFFSLDLVFWLGLGGLFISWNPREICRSHSLGLILVCKYAICVVWSDFSFLHNSQWISFTIQSCLVLYSFCANLLYSLIMWLIVSSLSPNYLYLLFCCIFSL